MTMDQILDEEIKMGLPETINITDVFHKYQAQLKGFISKRVLSDDDTEDILQNVFYQLAKVDPLVNPINQMSGWLYAVARNQIADWMRKQKYEEMPVVEYSEDDTIVREFTDLILAEGSSPELEYVRARVWDQFNRALDELPSEQREVFELTELEGFSFKEISESIDVSVNTLLSRKRYAVLHLRARLKKLYEELLED